MEPLKKKPYPDPALNVREQINLLRSKGLLIPETVVAEQWLSHISYFRFKNYSVSFKDYQNAGGNYLPDTKFSTITNLYDFDKKLRMIIFEAIESIEISVKTQLSNIMSSAYGPFWYLDASNFVFNAANVSKGINHQKILNTILKALRRASEPALQHYKITYEPVYPPSWMLMDVITFRTL